MIPLLDPDTVSRADSLGLIARMIVEGYKVGDHRSPKRGFAIEFAQHREYTTGDDLRHLDWKVLGRTDRYCIKQYEQDTNFVAQLMLDGSESMVFGSDKVRKIDYAKALTACVAHAILGQRDAIALNIFTNPGPVHMARTDNPGKMTEVLSRLAAFEAGGEANFGTAIEQVAARTSSRGIFVIISDFFGDEESLRQGIERLRFSGHEVVVFHVLDPAEISFPMKGTVRFEGLENLGAVQTSPAEIRKSYLEVFDAFRTRVRHFCERANCHYVLADTGVPLAETLGAYLAFRRRAAAR